MDGNDPLLRHISGFIIIRNGRPSLVLGDDHSLMGGSDDMKSGRKQWRLCGDWDFIFMFLSLDLECTLWD